MKVPDVPVFVRSVLITGISVSIPCLVTGVLLLLLHPAKQASPLSIADYFQALLRGEPQGLLFAGLAVLAMTPLVGVLAAATGFLLRRDRSYALIAAIVLLMTLATFFLRAH